MDYPDGKRNTYLADVLGEAGTLRSASPVADAERVPHQAEKHRQHKTAVPIRGYVSHGHVAESAAGECPGAHRGALNGLAGLGHHTAEQRRPVRRLGRPGRQADAQAEQRGEEHADDRR